jgi:hypothetical protein
MGTMQFIAVTYRRDRESHAGARDVHLTVDKAQTKLGVGTAVAVYEVQELQRNGGMQDPAQAGERTR